MLATTKEAPQGRCNHVKKRAECECNYVQCSNDSNCVGIVKLAQRHGGHGVVPFAGRSMVGDVVSEGFMVICIKYDVDMYLTNTVCDAVLLNHCLRIWCLQCWCGVLISY